MIQDEEQTYRKKSTRYRRKSSANCCLIILSLVLFLFVLGLAIALAISLLIEIKIPEAQICLSPGCVHTASTVLKYIDTSVNPCDNFYHFACGGYLKDNNIPEDASSIDSFTTLSNTVKEQLRTIIEEPLEPKTPTPYRLLQKFYNLCMNLTAVENDSLETVKQFLKDLGGWPLLEGETWNESKFDWKQSVYIFRKNGFNHNYFMSFNVATDSKNSSRRIIHLDQPLLSLSREFLVKGLHEEFVQAYFEYLVDMAVLFGVERTAALREIIETLEFEISLAQICSSREERRNLTSLYNPMTVEELQSKFTSIPWLEYLSKVLDIPDIEITEDEIVNVALPHFLSDLEILLRRTPKRVQANYIMVKSALSTVHALPKRFRNRHNEYREVLTGQKKEPPRWQECTNEASVNLHLVAGVAFLRKYFNEEAKKEVEDIVSNVRNEFLKILNASDWMDEVSKKKAIEKASAIVTRIAYPIEILDDKRLEKYYSNLEFTSDSYLKAMKAVTLFRTDYFFKQLREPVYRKHWTKQPYTAMVNAYYSTFENSIKFPAGILQGAFFSNDRPRYMNYGSMGFTVGHEITHSFDYKGSQFDKKGNLVDWWAESTKAAFNEKAQCVINQYGNYTVTEVELNFNGLNTQDENIADSGGLKAAYLAYQTWIETHGPEPGLPGLPYSPNQMFWISTASIWCGKYRKETLKSRVISGTQSPSEFRILGTFSNMNYFVRDFNCSIGSNMNPANKCVVW